MHRLLFPKERDPVPILQEAECPPPVPVRTTAEYLAPPEFHPTPVQCVACRYTDYAIPEKTVLAQINIKYCIKTNIKSENLRIFKVYGCSCASRNSMKGRVWRGGPLIEKPQRRPCVSL